MLANECVGKKVIIHLIIKDYADSKSVVSC